MEPTFVKIIKRERDILEVEAFQPISAIKRKKLQFLVEVEEFIKWLIRIRYKFLSGEEELGFSFVVEASKLDLMGRRLKIDPCYWTSSFGTLEIKGIYDHVLIIDLSGTSLGEPLIQRFLINDAKFATLLSGKEIMVSSERFSDLYEKRVKG